MAPVHILLADDHVLVRQGLRSLIQSQPDMVVIGEASNGQDAVAQARESAPDLILMDITMPVLDGLKATREIKQAQPAINILFLTVHDNDIYFFEALKSGGNGYITKSADSAELLEAIRTVAEGDTYVHPSMSRWLVKEFLDRSPLRNDSNHSRQLTIREREVVQLVSEGFTNQDIAQRLSISVNTVRNHRASLMTKLGLHDRMEILRYAIEHGFVSKPPAGEGFTSVKVG